MAMPSPASDSMAMDFAMMAGISRFHLQEIPQGKLYQYWKIKIKIEPKYYIYSQGNFKIWMILDYLNETRDQVRPIKLE